MPIVGGFAGARAWLKAHHDAAKPLAHLRRVLHESCHSHADLRRAFGKSLEAGPANGWLTSLRGCLPQKKTGKVLTSGKDIKAQQFTVRSSCSTPQRFVSCLMLLCASAATPPNAASVAARPNEASAVLCSSYLLRFRSIMMHQGRNYVLFIQHVCAPPARHMVERNRINAAGATRV